MNYNDCINEEIYLEAIVDKYDYADYVKKCKSNGKKKPKSFDDFKKRVYRGTIIGAGVGGVARTLTGNKINKQYEKNHNDMEDYLAINIKNNRK